MTSLGAPPKPADVVFGKNISIAVKYAEILASDGVERGVIGPQEVPRLWDRHLLNCAVIGELIARDCTVADVGSGAGLPGVALAIARPDLEITLIEPLLRRVEFLHETLETLALSNVAVIRARAEEAETELYDTVTARAVAPMRRLASRTLPLCKSAGQVVAIKGASVEDELVAAKAALRRAGATDWKVVVVGDGVVEEPTRVVVVQK